jgi:PAS domain S-box-containing protein
LVKALAQANARGAEMLTRLEELNADLERENKRAETYLNLVSVVIVALGPTGSIVRVNKYGCQVLGYSEDNLLGRDWLETCVPDDHRGETRAVLKRLMDGEVERVQYYENEIVTRSGERRQFAWHNTVVRDDNGHIVASLSAGEDITQRKQAERLAAKTRELERSNAELELFARVASHDLQEPLRTVTSYVQLLERRYKGKLDKDADEFIGFAVEGAKRMKALICDALEYSRVGTDGKELEPVDSAAVIKDSIRNLQAAIEESGASITWEGMPVVLADSTQLGRVFQNLIGNALKFRGKESPRVHIRAERSNGCWMFAVKDNGIGIDPKYADRMFVVFQRLHKWGEFPGTGIGLAVCKRIVERHGGKIWLESEPGKGTTFYFTMPANAKTEPETPDIGKGPSLASEGGIHT